MYARDPKTSYCSFTGSHEDVEPLYRDALLRLYELGPTLKRYKGFQCLDGQPGIISESKFSSSFVKRCSFFAQYLQELFGKIRFVIWRYLLKNSCQNLFLNISKLLTSYSWLLRSFWYDSPKSENTAQTMARLAQNTLHIRNIRLQLRWINSFVWVKIAVKTDDDKPK